MAHLVYYLHRDYRKKRKEVTEEDTSMLPREMLDPGCWSSYCNLHSDTNEEFELTLIMMLSLSCMASMNSRATSNSGLIQNLISS